jgi:hypothetical protein
MLVAELRKLGKLDPLIALVGEICSELEADGVSVDMSHNWDADMAAVGLQCNRRGQGMLVYLSMWRQPDGKVAVEVEGDTDTDVPSSKIVQMHNRETRGLPAWILSLLREKA